MYRLPVLMCFAMSVLTGMSCKEKTTPEQNDTEVLHITWKWEGSEWENMSGHEASFTIKHTGHKSIDGSWELYFNTLFLALSTTVANDSFTLEHISGDLWKLYPNFQETILPGQSITIPYKSKSIFFKDVQAPHGLYIVWDQNEASATRINHYHSESLTLEEMHQHLAGSKVPVPTPEFLYEQNQHIEETQNWHIIPTPKHFHLKEGFVYLFPTFTMVAPEELKNEEMYFSHIILPLFNGNGSNSEVDQQQRVDSVVFSINKNFTTEAYSIEVKGGAILIAGGSPRGVFYGIQSLISMISPDSYLRKNDILKIPVAEIFDEPAFSYRGMHMDVARNFHEKETIKKVIDLLAFYKINTLHFHLTNDEGWRLQIPGLPELTDVGGRKGHTSDEKKHMLPYYGSGPDVLTQYYSVEDFKEILRYAHSRHIEIIPEISVPGHARAAIFAMRKRYERLLKEGRKEEAELYLLEDLADRSVYMSVQNFRENTINVCMPSVYTFFEKVLDEVIKMYREAEVPLGIIHTGGDEVPGGVWTASPICEKLFDESTKLKGVVDLHGYFIEKINEIIRSKGLRTAGWEEIAQTHTIREDKEISIPNTSLANAGFLVFVWNSVAGWGSEDVAYQLANTGFDVVVCNSSNLYFDLAYNLDPNERGHTWSGFIDTKTAWSILPYNLFHSNDSDMFGNEIDHQKIAEGKAMLSPESRERIKGLQGQLWSETIHTREQLEYYLFPRLTGLAERAWKGQPDWGDISDEEIRKSEREKEWTLFANTVGRRELPRADHIFGGFHSRIPKPGAKMEDGKLHANIAYPGLIIRFTTDGSDPDKFSQVYKGPVNVSSKTIKLRAFTPSEKAGGVSKIVLNNH